ELGTQLLLEQGQAPADFELQLNLTRQSLEHRELVRAEHAGLPLEDAERAKPLAFGRTQRHSAIKPDVWLSDDQRVLRKAWIEPRVGHEQRRIRSDHVRAERLVPWGLRELEPVVRLEPQSVFVDQAHEGDWHAEDPRRQLGEIVERCLCRRVEYAVIRESTQARRIVKSHCSFLRVASLRK